MRRAPLPTANLFSRGDHLTKVAARLILRMTRVGFQTPSFWLHTYALRSAPQVTIRSLLGAQSMPRSDLRRSSNIKHVCPMQIHPQSSYANIKKITKRSELTYITMAKKWCKLARANIWLPVMCPLCSFNSWALTHWFPLFLYIWTSWLFGLMAISVKKTLFIVRNSDDKAMRKVVWFWGKKKTSTYGSYPDSRHDMWWAPKETDEATLWSAVWRLYSACKK